MEEGAAVLNIDQCPYTPYRLEKERCPTLACSAYKHSCNG